MTPKEALKKYFGYDGFRPYQGELIEEILAGRDVLGVMPTGAGKSLCYQIPALCLPGLTLVVSPLISLMQDQVAALGLSGVSAACLHSAQSEAEQREVFARAFDGGYQLLYVAPERLETAGFRTFCAENPPVLVAVDEAHCISQWGQDFRPSYLRLPALLEGLPVRPRIAAFTATATEVVREDIARLLTLRDPFVLVSGFDRPNLRFGVHATTGPNQKKQALLQYLKEHPGKSGIVYCSTRKTVDEVCALLVERGLSAGRYHAGMDGEERRQMQEDFLYDRISVMVATNAFGMGIDKSNISFVLHFNMPQDLESYYQEAGRAGRDGEPAECLLLYSKQDVRTGEFLISHSREADSELDEEARERVVAQARERLRQMTYYSTTTGCLRAFFLRYFGEDPPRTCGNCSNCLAERTPQDITIEAQKIVSCVYRLRQRGRAIGKRLIADILRGSKSERIQSMGFDGLSTYGIMKDTPRRTIVYLIELLAEEGYLTDTGGEYPVIQLNARSNEVIRERRPVTAILREDLAKEKVKPEPRAPRASREIPEGDSELYRRLAKLRAELANQANVPAYMVFSNATLREIAAQAPHTDAALLEVPGVGEVKLGRYGRAFLNCIAEYEAEKRQGAP